VETLLERERELAAVEGLLEGGGGVLVVEGGAGIGKTSLLDAADRRATQLGYETLRACGSQLEAGFAYGVVRQLFERRLASAGAQERDALLAGPAAAVRPLLLGEVGDASAFDTSFAVLHGLYWLTVNLADRRPLLIAVDDAHWADAPSLRWLAHLAPRVEGVALALLVAQRAGTLAALPAPDVVRPGLLSEDAVAALVRGALGAEADDELCAAAWSATGGNPLYLTELLRAVQGANRPAAQIDPTALLAGGRDAIARRVVARVRALDQDALDVAQAVAVLGDGCESRHIASVAGVEPAKAMRVAAGLVQLDVLAGDDPPCFIHPVVRDAIEASMGTDARDAAHRSAASALHADAAPPGRIAAHLMAVRPTGDRWVLLRLLEAAATAMQAGAPNGAADLLERALAEPPPREQRVAVLREAARADASAGREAACHKLEQALELAMDPREHGEIALELAEAYAALFRWVDAVDVVERALAGLGDADETLAARLEGELVVCGLHDARRASRVAPVLERLAARSPDGGAAEALAVAQGMAMVLAGAPAAEAARPGERALADDAEPTGNWDTRAALLWSLVTAERFDAVQGALRRMIAEVRGSGSARGLVATYSTLGLLHLRLGALPEADAAARVALRVLQEGDFAPGLAFAATVLADVAVEAGELDEAQALLDLLPQDGWPAGVATVLIPASRARLRLAQARPRDALADFRTCAAMFSTEAWGREMRDVGYLHARSGAALALLRLGERDGAIELADAELADVTAFAAPRARGIALRVAGLARGGERGLALLGESVSTLQDSPAVLERAHALAEWGAALRRAGRRTAAREALADALDLAARCGARPLVARVREELNAAGARPRREWRTGAQALTPSELRIARLAAGGRTNREIAQELYVTLKTVEGHLSRAYSKLGIERRAQVADALGEEKTRVATP
jgi:DNA-binding CsgD family transcriptional regulator